MPSRILVVAAHPDDEVLGCGATIAKRLRQRDRVSIRILGEGLMSRDGAPKGARRAQALSRLRASARSAARVLGTPDVACDDLPDNRFDAVDLLSIVKRVERWVEELRPEAIYTHHPGDLNIDHALTFRAVLTATRPVPGCPVKAVYAFEVPSSTEWAFQRCEPAFRPSVFVDVSSTLETKVKALRQYAGEVRPAPHPRSPEGIRAMAQRWGSVVGVKYAEAFELIRLLE